MLQTALPAQAAGQATYGRRYPYFGEMRTGSSQPPSQGSEQIIHSKTPPEKKRGNIFLTWVAMLSTLVGGGTGYVHLNQRIQQTHDTNQQLQHSVGQLGQENAFLKAQLDQLGGQVSLGQQQLDRALQNALAQTQQQDKTLEGQLNALKKQLRQEAMAAEQSSKALQSSLENLNNELSFQDIAPLVAKLSPTNVMIEGKEALGSGTWRVDSQGNVYILTNAHVVRDNSLLGPDHPPTFDVRLYDGLSSAPEQQVKAEVVKLANGSWAVDADHDLTLLKVAAPGFQLPQNIQPPTQRDFTKEPIVPGEFVLVIGSPLGLTDNVTFGIVSHRERTFEGESNIYFGIDAPISPGNSGGGVFDLKGRYLGPATAGIPRGNSLGFVVRTDIVDQVLNTWGIALK